MNLILDNHQDVQDINLTSTITVETKEGNGVSVTVPPELRLTNELVQLINQALQVQGLELKHMNITAQHQEELKKLSNVVLKDPNTEE